MYSKEHSWNSFFFFRSKHLLKIREIRPYFIFFLVSLTIQAKKPWQRFFVRFTTSNEHLYYLEKCSDTSAKPQFLASFLCSRSTNKSVKHIQIERLLSAIFFSLFFGCCCCFFSPFFFSFTAITKGINNNPFEAKNTKLQCSDSFYVKCAGFRSWIRRGFFFWSVFTSRISWKCFFHGQGVFQVGMTNLYFFDLNDKKWCILVPDDIDHV